MKPNAAKVSETGSDDVVAQKTSSAQTVASIDDLLIQVLLSIPLKPLLRLKLVSKRWNSIISHKSFNLLRNQNPNPPAGLIFSVVINGPAFCPLSYVVPFDKPSNVPVLSPPCRALNSCNGLLLCQTRRTKPNHIYFVCNPTTNQHFNLPKVDPPGLPYFYSMNLAFDPSKSPHYKVVCVVMTVNWQGVRRPIYIAVYSSETGRWIKHSCCEPFPRRLDFNRGVYWNGAIHWISAEKSLYFNPENDRGVLRVMPTPPPMIAQRSLYNRVPQPPKITPRKPHETHDTYRPHKPNHFCLVESCGHLHYIDDDKTVMELDVYEMRTDYSEWFIKYRVDCSLIDDRLDSIIGPVVRSKKDEDTFLVLQSEKRIIRYNLVYKTCETVYEILDAGAMRFFRGWGHPLQYIESLSNV